MTKKYYAYDHSNEDRLTFTDFGVFMYWIDNIYDKEKGRKTAKKKYVDEIASDRDNFFDMTRDPDFFSSNSKFLSSQEK